MTCDIPPEPEPEKPEYVRPFFKKLFRCVYDMGDATIESDRKQRLEMDEGFNPIKTSKRIFKRGFGQ
jgi:hypothetical protein